MMLSDFEGSKGRFFNFLRNTKEYEITKTILYSFVLSPRSRAKLATGQPRSELRSTSGA